MKNSNNLILKSLLLIVSLLTAVNISANDLYYFQVNAKATPTGSGKVYVSQSYVPTENIQENKKHEETEYLWQAENKGKAGTSRFHLYAFPNEGYAFKNWTKGDHVVSLMKHCSLSERSTSKDIDNPAIFEYVANFVEKGAVAVYSNNESAGTVIIDNPENNIGDVVKLEAITDIFIGDFLGWIHGSVDFQNVDLKTLDFVSTSKDYTFTVTAENQGDYYAVFAPRSEQGIYCMVSNYKTHHCMGIRGTSEYSLSDEQRYFHNSVELIPIEKAHSTPATVVKISGAYDGVGGIPKAEYISQGFSSKDIAGSKVANIDRFFRIEPYSTQTYLTYAEGSGYTGYWREYREKGSKNLYDDNEELLGPIYHPWTGNASEIYNDHQWQILPLTEELMEEYYFGAEPKEAATWEGKYLTTMYTSFPYKCMDGVKAYTVDKYLKNARVHLCEIESDTVPAYTAVILACNGTTAKENRLIPLIDDVPALESTNYLKGEIWLDDESGNPDNFRTRFDSKTMRVFSDNNAKFVNQNNRDTANGDTLLTYIANNTCYLQLDPQKAALPQYTLTTEDDPEATLLGDADGNGIVNITDVLVTTNMTIGKTPSAFVFENADVNKDNEITITDIILIVNISLGKSY